MLVGFSSRTRFAGFEVVSFSKAIMVLVSRRNRVTVTVRQVQDAPVALAVLGGRTKSSSSLHAIASNQRQS